MSKSQEFEDLIFNKNKSSFRYTQDSPVYPNVLMKYLEIARSQNLKLLECRLDLILTPHRLFSSGDLLVNIRNSLFERKEYRQHSSFGEWELSTNGETVAVKCTFQEMLYCLLPHTSWFKVYFLENQDNSQNWLKSISDFILAVESNSKKIEHQLDNFSFSELSAIAPKTTSLWSISMNRQAKISLYKSVLATKGDAARRLFDIKTSRISWAVFDTGIDSKHIAFKKEGEPFSSRIIATYDFTKFREIISDLHIIGEEPNSIGSTSNNVNKRLSKQERRSIYQDAHRSLNSGRMLDWDLIEPLIRIPHNLKDYIEPKHPHGTHVAGIIGANWESHPKSIVGMCPDINLYDIRVLNEDGVGDEFNIIAAIQFVRWLNRQKDLLVVHGVNISISIYHEVESFACGQTPVCESCKRLISEGTVIVSSAGNLGQAVYENTIGGKEQGFRTVNITDPGNSNDVITVGATHRNKPHTYGVSYFSSRGPTGDGRSKPDLVAPGEKIVSTTPGDNYGRMDGTSMATPHVSGAAALLLATNRELIGNPKLVKEILCGSATDLKREKYFQGRGMLDVLRSLQSI